MDLPWLCPICRPKRAWKSSECPHSVAQVERRIEDDRIREVAREEMAKVLGPLPPKDGPR